MFARLIISLVVTFAAAFSTFSQGRERPLSITLSSAADVLITRADGKRVGRDPAIDNSYNEIPGAEAVRSPGREPVYDVPPGTSREPVTITIFGRKAVSDAKLAVTGPNFVFGVNGITLAKGTVVTVRVAPLGDLLEYSSNVASAVPHIVLGVDPSDSRQPSYVFEVGREPFTGKGTIRIEYLDQRSFSFGDDAKPLAAYEFKLTRINAEGSEIKYSGSGLRGRRAGHFAVELAAPKGPCLRSDNGPKWLTDGSCRPLPIDNSK